MTEKSATSLRDRIEGSPFQGYAYAYPHKTSYRVLSPPTTWEEAWREEDRSSLFLYVHVPYCTVRCGFCNLFTTRGATQEGTEQYLASLGRQIAVAADALGPEARFSRMAIGGGTPTFLEAGQLEALLASIEGRLGCTPSDAPCSVETSPETATEDRLAVLESAGVSRVSIGVQAFDEQSCRAMGRPQLPQAAHGALTRIRRRGFEVLNIDLIYGAEGQTVAAFEDSIRAALRYEPEELYLYPLYVRRLTGLGGKTFRSDDIRIAQYRAGRDLLLSAGYRQVSMRMFTRAPAQVSQGPDYCCQRDGMVGLGPGARSYTSSLHYSTEYAVGQSAVRTIVEAYAARGADEHAAITHGFWLEAEERRRRYVIQSLLQAEGLALDAYGHAFGQDVYAHLPFLSELTELRLAQVSSGRLRLTGAGMEYSDVIGPWLASESVRAQMESYAWR